MRGGKTGRVSLGAPQAVHERIIGRDRSQARANPLHVGRDVEPWSGLNVGEPLDTLAVSRATQGRWHRAELVARPHDSLSGSGAVLGGQVIPAGRLSGRAAGLGCSGWSWVRCR